MNTVPVSVLIPTMNRPRTLERTLLGYLQGEKLPSEIIVVDQSTDPQTAQENKNIVEGHNKQIKMVYLYQRVPSSTASRNTAQNMASEDILVFSDDDVDVYTDTVGNVYSIMQTREVALIAGTDDNTVPSNSKIGYLFGTKSFKKRKIGHVTKSMLGRYPTQVVGQVDTEWAMGYFFAVRKSLVQKWGISWDERLSSYAYAEDLDYSHSYQKKAVEENMQCILSDQVHVRHLVSKEYRTPSRKVLFAYVYNRLYLAHKHKKRAFHVQWCNLCMVLQQRLSGGNPRDMIDAIKCARKDYKKIINGEIDYNKYL